MLPVVRPSGSDTAIFDNVLELLVLAGRSLPHAMMMMIPEAYQGRDDLPDELKGFYAYHQCLMEAWDGPAAIAFTDGRVIGATLDRNGLRPGRWYETKDGWVVLASETGVLDEPAGEHPAQGPPAAGQALPRRPRARPDRRRRRRSSARSRRRKPYGQWYEQEVVRLADLPEPESAPAPTESLRRRQLAFGYTQEDMKVILAPLARNAEEAVGSMGNDSSLAVLSDRKPLLYSYFKQLFAQVTNPPIDSIREAVVMSVQASVGSERNLLDETPEHARQLVIDNPILLDSRARAAAPGALGDLQVAHARRHLAASPKGPPAWSGALAARLRRGRPGARRRREHPDPLRPRRRARARAHPARCSRCSAVHHHLVRAGRACRRAWSSSRARRASVHSVAVLVGYGAGGGQPVPDARDALRARRATAACPGDDGGGGAAAAPSRASRRAC